MIIGVPREIKSHENRVSLLPSGVVMLKRRGHRVLVEEGAGVGSGFPDERYREAGAEIITGAGRIWSEAEMIMKVKEPIRQEYPLMREGQIIFTFFHFAASEELTRAVMDSGCLAIAYETVERPDRSLPLLIPMSEVAGRMSVQQGAKYLEKAQGGRGVLLSGIPGVRPGSVLVLGGGIVGVNAAKMAAGMGANVTIMDISLPRLRYLDDIMPRNVTTLYSSESNIRDMLPSLDLIIGGVLIPGAKAPRLITRDMLRDLRPGSVLVDVAIDQGGSMETARPTTHDDPVYVVDDVIHYCVANMPGAVPYTSTVGLTNATMPYALQIADKGWKDALKENPDLVPGLNVAFGEITHKDVAGAFDLDWKPVESVWQ
ncbi:alanine dehydrogenase [Balneolales bacterium ANBcel1]|nr:alanine dehydrogenase [Balneolales bacterium ANBcel1]